jgi:hypothetical protein
MPLIKEPEQSVLMAAAAALIAAGLPVAAEEFSAALIASLEASSYYFATFQVRAMCSCEPVKHQLFHCASPSFL